MKQKKITSMDALLAAGRKVGGGAEEFGEEIGTVFGSKTAVDRDLNALLAARDDHNTAKAELVELRKTLAAAVKDGLEFAAAARDMLKRTLGRSRSVKWTGTGYERSLQLPRSTDAIREVVRCLSSFFANFPDLQVAQFNLTSVRATALVQAITDAQNAVNAQITQTNTLLDVRRTKERTLRRRISGLTEELGRLIEPLDPRWHAYGLNQPGAKETPPAPEKVVVLPMTADKREVRWERAPRAKHYRVWLKAKDGGEEPRCVGSAADLHFILEDLPPNTAMGVGISAVNSGGESSISEFVIVASEDATLPAG